MLNSLTTTTLPIVFVTSALLQTTSAQELNDVGIFATGVLSRTRFGPDDFQLGDMMYVTALHPANSGSMYVSAHMEYLDNQQQWQPVPTANTPLGGAYRSPRYAGIRDYIKFQNCSENTTRRVCLFMPYHAAALPSGQFYQRRYVLRVWDHRNQPVARVKLEAEPVETRCDENGGFMIVTVKVKACASLPQPDDDIEPVPESVDDGTLRFFSAKTGEFLCPDDE